VGNNNRGLGLLYLLLGIGVVVTLFLVGALDQVLPVIQTHNWGSLFTAELAPNLFISCTLRGFTFYVDDVGNRRQGDFGFQEAGLFTEFSLVSRATGKTIQDFEQEVRIECNANDPSFEQIPFRLIDRSTAFTTGEDRSLLLVDLFATDINGNEKLVKTSTVTIAGQTIPYGQEVIIGKAVFSASDIETAIAPREAGDRAGAGGVDPSIQQFNSQIRFDTGYTVNFEYQSTEWRAFGEIDNGYRVTWINDNFSAEPTDPQNTDIILQLQSPSNGLLTSNKQIIVNAVLPNWSSGEGNPSFKVTSEQTGATLASTVMTLAGQDAEKATFNENVILRTDETGKFKITVSTTSGRVPATLLVSTAEPTMDPTQVGGDPETRTCVVPIGFVDSALIATLSFLTGSCIEDVQKQCSSGLIPVLNVCIPAGIAGLLQGINLIILFVVLIVIAIIIKIAIAIARKPKQTARAFIPSGL
jgi:hypothetical protein